LVGRFAGRTDQRVWEAWREFELLELAKCEAAAAVSSASAAAAEANAAELEKQRSRVLGLFRRHLAMPHVGLEATWRELCDWLAEKEQQPAEEMRQVYEKSRDELRRIEPFENLLADEPDKSAQHYRAYIEAAVGPTAQQLAVLERAVTAHCLDTGLWDAYVAYVWQQFEPGPKLLHLCRRAVRNCPWSGSLWRQLALCQECTGCDYDTEVKVTYESAVAAGLSDAADLLAMWLAYLDAARRRAAATESWDDWHRLCEAGMVAVDAMAADPQASLLRYAALVRARRGQLGEARQLWDQVMKRGHGNSAQMWLRQLEFELRFGDAKHIRRCLSRAVNSVSSVPECELLLQRLVDYEREEGDVSSYVEALKRAQKQRALLQQRAAEQGGSGSGGKRKAGSKGGATEAQPPPNKRAKGLETGKKQHTADGAAAKTDPFKKPMPPPPPAAASSNNVSHHGAKVEHDPAKDYRTVFLSNLDYKTDEAGIRQALAPCASDIVSVRLVRDYRGRSKGFAYVELKSGVAAGAALRLDRTLVNGRPMFVSESRQRGGGSSDTSANDSAFKFDTGLERNKLFIRNLPKTMDQAGFERLCSAQPGYRTARLAMFRNGAPKGHGYAEFADESSANKALAALNCSQVGDNEIEVSISNPPARQGGGGRGGGGRGRGRGGGGGRREDHTSTDPTRHRTQISLVPRQLKTSADTSGVSASGSESGSGGGRMSNDDFRNMLMRK
uniref:RRM domain-containing protein n=1 Tax=Macrostomum lignano TaxID=282301 RepID=A0A1I8I1C0_9PLAT